MLRFGRKQHDTKIPYIYHLSNTPAAQTLQFIQTSQSQYSSEHKLIRCTNPNASTLFHTPGTLVTDTSQSSITKSKSVARCDLGGHETGPLAISMLTERPESQPRHGQAANTQRYYRM